MMKGRTELSAGISEGYAGISDLRGLCFSPGSAGARHGLHGLARMERGCGLVVAWLPGVYPAFIRCVSRGCRMVVAMLWLCCGLVAAWLPHGWPVEGSAGTGAVLVLTLLAAMDRLEVRH